MNKQVVLYKLATLRLAINYVLRNRGLIKSAATPPGSMFRPKNRVYNTEPVTLQPSKPTPTPSMGVNKNQYIQDTVTNPLPENQWQWDNEAEPQAQPVAMGASKSIPRQPKPSYPTSNMNFRNGQYYGKGNITTWGNQIAEERNRLNTIYKQLQEKGITKWNDSYKTRSQALTELENKWNEFNNLRQGNRLSYDKATGQYTGYSGDNSLIDRERQLLDMAKGMYSPERLEKSLGGYDQRMESLNNIPGNTGLPYNPYDNTVGPVNVPTEDSPKLKSWLGDNDYYISDREQESLGLPYSGTGLPTYQDPAFTLGYNPFRRSWKELRELIPETEGLRYDPSPYLGEGALGPVWGEPAYEGGATIITKPNWQELIQQEEDNLAKFEGQLSSEELGYYEDKINPRWAALARFKATATDARQIYDIGMQIRNNKDVSGLEALFNKGNMRRAWEVLRFMQQQFPDDLEIQHKLSALEQQYKDW